MSADGGGERHVGPPRTVEIQKFAAARSAEVQALYNAVKDHVESSGGDPSSLTIARHLRRRTTSHSRRLPYWILNERKKNREGHASQQKRKKAKKDEPASSPGASEKRKAERPPPCRRVRRRIEFQRVRGGEDIVQPDGTRRLATHVWHAKRFPMTKCWGYSLPEGLPGRGRGSRAVLKWGKEAAVLHDASYYGLIELQGTSEAIARSLQQTVEPAICFPNSGSPLKKAEAHGLLSGNAVLYQFGKAPYDAIAPITFMWRPPTSDLKLRATGSEQAQANVTAEERQLWIWVHPGAYESALQCLSTACERQDKDSVTNPVKCRSRRGEFARLEILGGKATEVMRKVIHPTSRKFGTLKATNQPLVRDIDALHPGYPTDGGFGQPSNLAFFSKAEFLPSSAVLALDVLDPRCTSSYRPSVQKTEGGVENEGPHMETREDIQSASQTVGDDASVREGRTEVGASHGDSRVVVDEDYLNYCARWLNMAEEGLSREVSDSEYLWNPQSGAQCTRSAPMSEKKLCKKRHEERKEFLLNVNQGVTTNGAKSNAKEKMVTSSVCPVLLLRSSKSVSGTCGWTIILPIKWVHAFWIPLVFAGGRVIGLRERHWLATNAGIPHFPHDFPDSSTYAQLLAAKMAVLNEANRKRPPAKRGPCFVVSPLQVSILRIYEDSNRSKVTTKTDEPDGSFIGAESSVSHNFDSHGSEKISCITDAAELTNNMEESPDASCLVVDVERHEKSNSRYEFQNDDKVVSCATDSARMVIELSSDSVLPETRNDADGPETFQPGLETERVLCTGSSAEAGQMVRSISVAGINSGAAVSSSLLSTNRDTKVGEVGLFPERQVLANVYSQCTKLANEVDRSTPGGVAVSAEGSQASSLQQRPAHQVDVSTRCGTDLMDTAAGHISVERNIQDCDSVMGAGEVVSSTARSGVSQPDSSDAAVKTFIDDGDGSLGQNAPSNPSVSASTNPYTFVPKEEAKIVLGGLSNSLALDPKKSDSGGAAVETFISGTGTAVTERHAVSYPARDSVTTDVEASQPRSEAPALTMKSDRSDCQADAPERFLMSDAVKAGVEGLNFSKVLDIKPAITAREEVDREDTPKKDETMYLVGEEVGDGGARRDGANVERKSLSFFVARTQNVLQDILNQSGSQHAIFLHEGGASRDTNRDALQQETVRCSANDAACSVVKRTPVCALVNGEEKVCYMKVLVSVPRKGVMEEGAVIFSPSNEDRDTFSRSKDWQGPSVVEPKNAKRKRKGKENKVKMLASPDAGGAVEGSRDTYEDAVAFCEAWSNNRKSIGLITSSAPRGSTSACIGICDVGALMELRAAQSGDQRWDGRDIFVLAGNKHSSKLRPALISLHLERAEADIEWL